MAWSYFDRFEEINKKYLPYYGEGETKASQIVTAVNKLIYRWFNDGDVYDNVHHMTGWVNDLSSYANWLDGNTQEAGVILGRIFQCSSHDEYEAILKDLADTLLNVELLEKYQVPRVGTIYTCSGRFCFNEAGDDDCDDEEDDA